MSTFRTGNHWGVTIAREGQDVTHLIADGSATMSCCGRTPFELPRRGGHLLTADPAAATCPHANDELVAVVVNGDQALAERICELLNAPTPDVPYTSGAREALAEVRRRLDIAAEPDEQLFAATIHKILEHAAAEVGVPDWEAQP